MIIISFSDIISHKGSVSVNIDLNNKEPLYIQLRNIIKQNIEDGIWEEGAMIPSEKELAEKYEVSRVTVRKAISKLVDDKYLIRRAGFGTMVYRNRTSLSNFTQICSFTNEMKEIGLVNKTLEAELTLIEADEFLSEIFNIPKGSPLYNFKRVRGDDVPILFSDTYLLPVTEIPNTEEFLKGSLYSFLTSNNIYFNYFEEVFSAVKASKEILEKLRLEEDSAQLKRIRYSYDTQNQLIEYTVNYYNADLYEFRTSMTYRKNTSYK